MIVTSVLWLNTKLKFHPLKFDQKIYFISFT